MLKGIPKLLSPELLKILCEMGHGDTIILADANFPAERFAKTAKIIRYDGIGCCELLDAILRLFPLDSYIPDPVTLMQVAPGIDVETPIWEDYGKIIHRHDERGATALKVIERYAFYGEAEKAYAIIATGESAHYANMILQKGVL